MAANITTAVDSLVKLVNNKGRISLDSASKELGLPENILNEWATFLDQEGIIHIEYKFTTPFLMSKSSGEKKESTVDYEMILRKLQVMEAHLEKAKPAEEKQIKQKQYLRKLQVMEAHLEKAKPAEEKQIKQKQYLLKEIKKLMDLTKKKKVTKEQLQKLIKYYAIFNRG